MIGYNEVKSERGILYLFRSLYSRFPVLFFFFNQAFVAISRISFPTRYQAGSCLELEQTGG